MNEHPSDDSAKEPQPSEKRPDASEQETLFRRAYPESLRTKEREFRCSDQCESGRFKVGVALSGGGVRSATFCFGVLQAIAAKNAIGDIDILSTVSGGGYTGSLLNRLFTRKEVHCADDVKRAILPAKFTQQDNDAQHLNDREEQIKSGAVLRWLRENGHHLAPNGAGDLLLGGAVMVRNWLTVQFVLATFLLTGFVALHLVRGAVHSFPPLSGYGQKLDSSVLSKLPLADAYLSWSPWIVVPVVILLFTTMPVGIAYWLSTAYVKSSNGLNRLRSMVASVMLLFLLGALGAVPAFLVGGLDALAVAAVFRQALGGAPAAALAAATWLALFVALLTSIGFAIWAACVNRSKHDTTTADLAIGHRLSVCITWSLVAFAATFALAMVDTLGGSIYKNWGHLGTLFAPIGGLVAVGVLLAAAGGRRAVLALQGLDGALDAGTLTKAFASLIAGMVLFVVLTTVNTASHTAVRLGHWSGADSMAPGTFGSLVWLLVLVLLSWLMGRSTRFLNDSTLQPLYRARLARAYLGASNRNRIKGGNPVTRVIQGDDCPVVPCGEQPYRKGAPLHLINVTINETLHGKSRLQRNDRKGIGMAVGPAGISAGVRHHMVYANGENGRPEIYPDEEMEFAMFDSSDGGERLTLGQWTGISGAAFSTGLGSRTNFGFAFLAAFANVRLGYWWDSGVKPGHQHYSHMRRGQRSSVAGFGAGFTRWFPVQSHLIDEFFARFHGTGRRRWNLSDGGHFENLGAYELIRRRVRLIVIVDSEADPEYEFGGLGNLVRKARLDFAAEIRFLGNEELDQLGNRRDDNGVPVRNPCLEYVGSLNDLGAASTMEDGGKSDRQYGESPRGARAHAALAEVRYDGKSEVESWIVYVKPTLVGDEPADIANYRATHPRFPQQTTKDQFFDEPQWESYRKLGELIGRRVFAGDTNPFEAIDSLFSRG